MALNAHLIGQDAGTITAGQRVYTDVGSDRRVPQGILDKLFNRAEGLAPIYVMMRRMNKRMRVHAPTFKHLETDNLPTAVETNGSQTSGDTSIELTTGHGGRVAVGTILYCQRTDELMRVTAISTDTLTVERDYAGTSASALNDDEELLIQGFADTEGNTSPRSISSEPTAVTNALQTFRQAFELSGRSLEGEYYGGKSEKARMGADASDALQLQIERALLYNVGIQTTNPTMTAGFKYWISTNAVNQGGVLTEADLNSFIKRCYRYNQTGSKNIVCPTGELIRDAVDGFGRDLLRYDPNDKVGGIAIERYQSSHGSIPMLKHALLSPNGSQNSPGLAGHMFFLNLDKAGRAVYGNRDWHLRTNIQENDRDGEKHEYLTDEGLYVATEEAHGFLYGVTG